MQFLVYIYIIFSTIFISFISANNISRSNFSIENIKDQWIISNKIIGGENANIRTYPFIVSIQSKLGQHYCGGSIVAPELILTAAHCVYGENPDEFSIIAGQTNVLASDSSSSQRRDIKRFLSHPEYDPGRILNDIACCRLKRPLKFSDYVKPIKLPQHEQSRDLTHIVKTIIYIGWGSRDMKRSGGNVLQHVKTPVITFKECNKFTKISVNQMCTMVKEGGKDACQGDSGGPLVAADDTFLQYGIVSYGQGCARPMTPAVNTRVDKYLDFIERCSDENNSIYDSPQSHAWPPFVHRNPNRNSCSNNIVPFYIIVLNLLCIIIHYIDPMYHSLCKYMI